jgi:hypothetical protein
MFALFYLRGLQEGEDARHVWYASLVLELGYLDGGEDSKSGWAAVIGRGCGLASR